MNYRPNPRALLLSLLIGAGMLVFASVAAYAVWRVNATSEELCAVAIDSRDALRLVLLEAQEQDQRPRAQEFYNHVLVQIPPYSCEDGRPVHTR